MDTIRCRFFYTISNTATGKSHIRWCCFTSENKNNPSEIKTEDLPIYHEIGSDSYVKNSSPLKIYFSLNLSEMDDNHSDNKLKYYILEWGDEDIQLYPSEDILDSEFFEIYETEDESYDKFTVKELIKYVNESDVISGGEIMEEDSQRGKIHEHIYSETGVKTIKTIVFRMDNEENLLETSLVYTKIFITDPNKKIQNFNIFGQDYTVLPVEEK